MPAAAQRSAQGAEPAYRRPCSPWRTRITQGWKKLSIEDAPIQSLLHPILKKVIYQSSKAMAVASRLVEVHCAEARLQAVHTRTS